MITLNELHDYSNWITRPQHLQQNLKQLRLSVNRARPSGLAKHYHRSELAVLITSQFKIKLIPEQKVRRFEGRLSAESPLSKRALLEESLMNVASVFKVLQSCGAGMACRIIIVETAERCESFKTRIHFCTLRCRTLHKVFKVIQIISENKINALTSGLRNSILSSCFLGTLLLQFVKVHFDRQNPVTNPD